MNRSDFDKMGTPINIDLNQYISGDNDIVSFSVEDESPPYGLSLSKNGIISNWVLRVKAQPFFGKTKDKTSYPYNGRYNMTIRAENRNNDN